MDRKQFVEEELSRILQITKPHFTRCKYIEAGEKQYETCRIFCENGYYYDICIEANSLHSIVYDAFLKTMYE